MHSWEVISGATLRTSAYRLVRVEVGDRAGGRGGWRTRWRIWQGRGRRATSTSPCGLRCGGAAGRGLVMREAVTGRTRATGVLISGRSGARACPRGQAVREQQRAPVDGGGDRGRCRHVPCGAWQTDSPGGSRPRARYVRAAGRSEGMRRERARGRVQTAACNWRPWRAGAARAERTTGGVAPGWGGGSERRARPNGPVTTEVASARPVWRPPATDAAQATTTRAGAGSAGDGLLLAARLTRTHVWKSLAFDALGAQVRDAAERSAAEMSEPRARGTQLRPVTRRRARDGFELGGSAGASPVEANRGAGARGGTRERSTRATGRTRRTTEVASWFRR